MTGPDRHVRACELVRQCEQLIEQAAPRCLCGEPVRLTEFVPFLTPGGEWLYRATMVCGLGHRMPVQPLP